jgi:hypothetical protein
MHYLSYLCIVCVQVWAIELSTYEPLMFVFHTCCAWTWCLLSSPSSLHEWVEGKNKIIWLFSRISNSRRIPLTWPQVREWMSQVGVTEWWPPTSSHDLIQNVWDKYQSILPLTSYFPPSFNPIFIRVIMMMLTRCSAAQNWMFSLIDLWIRLLTAIIIMLLCTDSWQLFPFCCPFNLTTSQLRQTFLDIYVHVNTKRMTRWHRVRTGAMWGQHLCNHSHDDDND